MQVLPIWQKFPEIPFTLKLLKTAAQSSIIPTMLLLCVQEANSASPLMLPIKMLETELCTGFVRALQEELLKHLALKPPHALLSLIWLIIRDIPVHNRLALRLP